MEETRTGVELTIRQRSKRDILLKIVAALD